MLHRRKVTSHSSTLQSIQYIKKSPSESPLADNKGLTDQTNIICQIMGTSMSQVHVIQLYVIFSFPGFVEDLRNEIVN